MNRTILRVAAIALMLLSTPTKKGIYIYNGKKVAIR